MDRLPIILEDLMKCDGYHTPILFTRDSAEGLSELVVQSKTRRVSLFLGAHHCGSLVRYDREKDEQLSTPGHVVTREDIRNAFQWGYDGA